MPAEASGSTLMTLGADVTLATITSAGVFEITLNGKPILNGESLILTVQKKTLTGSTTEIVDRMVVCNNAPLAPIIEDKPRVSRFELIYKLRQDGGTARTIDWAVEKLQTLA